MRRKKGWRERHERFIKKHAAAARAVAVFVCGRELCRDGQPHQWDGKGIDDGHMSSATCSKCGLAAIDHDLMVLP